MRKGPKPQTKEERITEFWNRVQRSDGCWNWVRGKFDNGYGAFKMSGKLRGAHRIAWELSNCRPIPSGLVVMHVCDNKVCVRPDHLRLGTQADNMADKMAKGRHRWVLPPPGSSPKGEKNGHARLTEEQVRNIRRLHAAGALRQRAYARSLGVSPSLISHIVRGFTWRHVHA